MYRGWRSQRNPVYSGCRYGENVEGFFRPKPNGAAGVSWNEAVCDRQCVNLVRNHHNPPAASFTPRIERPKQMNLIPNQPRTGFTLLEIMIVVAIIGLLASMAIPNFMEARAKAQANLCISNLTQIDAAASEFALENGRKNGDAINYPGDLTPYLKLNRAGGIPGCPANGAYAEPAVGTPPSCSLSSTVAPPHLLP